MTSPLDLIRPPTGLYLKDDFYANDAVADATLGELRWELVTIGNVSVPTFLTQQGIGAYGVLRLTTAATADGDGSVIRLDEDGLIIRPGCEFGFKLRYPIELIGNFRVGLQDSVTATSPTVGVWIDSDAGVLSCQVDSADHGDESELVNGPEGTSAGLTSGTTMAIGSFYEFYARCSSEENAQGGPAYVDFQIGLVDTAVGRPWMKHVARVPCNIDDDEEVEFSIAHWQDSGGADAVALDIDFAYLWIPR